VVEEAISTRTAAIISYHPPIFKPISSFTLTNPLQKSLLLCTAHGISVFSPHTALDSVKGGINDWLSDIVQAAASGSVEYVGAPKEDELGGEGRLVRFQQPVELGSLVNVIKRGLGLSAGMCRAIGHSFAVTHFPHYSESPTRPLGSPALRQGHVGGYMRR
jgi:putative NIF3 family GTP cyclohydrolase 1 type 2